MTATQYSELIVDKDEFLLLWQDCNKVFDTTRRLPDPVFRIPFKKNYAFERAQIFMNDFPAFLRKLADAFSDDTVNYMTVDPDAADYYLKHCGFYGLASFERDKLAERYLKVMTRDRGAVSFRTIGDIGVFWGSSLEWGIFCDRVSWELCLMGTSIDVDKSILAIVGCMDSARVASYIENEYKHKPSVAASFLSNLAANYPNL